MKFRNPRYSTCKSLLYYPLKSKIFGGSYQDILNSLSWSNLFSLAGLPGKSLNLKVAQIAHLARPIECGPRLTKCHNFLITAAVSACCMPQQRQHRQQRHATKANATSAKLLH